MNTIMAMATKVWLLLCAISLASCSDMVRQVESFHLADTLAEEVPSQICYNMEIALIDSSNTRTTIESGRARVYTKAKQTVLDSGVVVYFFDKIGRKKGSLTALQVDIDDASKDMFAKGNVVVLSDSAATKLETKELKWRQKTRKIHTEAFVKITSPSEIINGYGFESNEDLSNYVIYRVTGMRGVFE